MATPAKVPKIGKSDPKQYNSAWESLSEFKDWLGESLVLKGKGAAWCKLCETALRAHKTDLRKHRRTKVHSDNEKSVTRDSQGRRQPTLAQVIDSTSAEKKKKQTIDLKLSAYVACHTSIRAIDHLGELLVQFGEAGSTLKSLKLHRTKCSGLIMHVLAPEMLKELVADVGGNAYSIIVDESTDTTMKKYMAVMIRYYSYAKKQMITDFLGLIPLVRQTADVLYGAFKDFMGCVGLPLKPMVGLGTDGALNLTGVHHSLYTLLKRNDCPKLALIKCICHSLDKCASYASKELPPALEFMVRETTGWFSHSTIRKDKYEQVYKTFNDGKNPPMLVKLAATRWLSWGRAVERVLDQFEPLKAMFQEASGECTAAQNLAASYNTTNKLYLTFLKPILLDLNKRNAAFQSTSADITEIYRDLRVFVFSTARRILKADAVPVASAEDGVLRTTELQALRAALSNAQAYLSLDRMQFGAAFDEYAKSLALPPPVFDVIRKKCADFLVRLCRELVERLPSCINTVERLRFLARPVFNT